MKGRLSRRPAVAIVGSRRDTRYGREMTRRIARDLAEAGVTVVSGLARGIDTAAHEGALEGRGITVAVLGNGLPGIYPGENRSLADRIISSGGAVNVNYIHSCCPMFPPHSGTVDSSSLQRPQHTGSP